MTLTIGVRKEDKNVWERRVPLTPNSVGRLKKQGIEIQVERFERRAYIDDDYEGMGGVLTDDVTPCDLVLGIKEMPLGKFRPGGAYMFFSHTIKGQPRNMPMLRRLVELGCTLLDYELVKDDSGRRLIFFGRFAGLAGMIDTLWTVGQRLLALDLETPFANMEQAHEYPSLQAAREAVSVVGHAIEEEGLPAELAPMVFGFTGYGNVSMGAQEIFDLLPFVEVTPQDLASFVAENPKMNRKLVKVVYKEEHLAAPNDAAKPFDLLEYYNHPERFHSIFDPHLDLLSVLINGIFWTEKYPRLATREQLLTRHAGGRKPKLVTVGDISCDVNGSLACTVRETEPGHPVFVYNPENGEAPAGFEGEGLAVMAVGNLPCELPMESSTFFSRILEKYIPALAAMDLSAPFKSCMLHPELMKSVILWRGEFTPPFTYMRDFLA